MKSYCIALLLTFSGLFNAHAQFMRESQSRALDTLQKLKAQFKAATNDSVFVSQHSDNPYKMVTFFRGDQAEDIEEQIYKTPVGGVAGPFRGEGTTNYLFKVVKVEEYSLRNKASLVYIKFNDMEKQDNDKLQKLATKYSNALANGKKEVKEMAEKDDVRLIFKDLGWYYQKDTTKIYFEQVYNSEKNSSFVIKTEHGPSILYVTTPKEKTPYKVRLIPLVKKG